MHTAGYFVMVSEMVLLFPEQVPGGSAAKNRDRSQRPAPRLLNQQTAADVRGERVDQEVEVASKLLHFHFRAATHTADCSANTYEPTLARTCMSFLSTSTQLFNQTSPLSYLTQATKARIINLSIRSPNSFIRVDVLLHMFLVFM